jgi:hypothetical protein
MKNKEIISIVFVLLITLTSFPAFSQQNSATANENEKDPFFSVKAQFSYFPSFVQVDQFISTDPVYPYGFSPAAGYAIQLGMGLKLFSTVNAFLDFDLNDPYMSEAMQIAGKIGTKYFDVMYTYKSTSFPKKTIDTQAILADDEDDQWYFPQEGEELESKLNVGTLALMSTSFFGYKIMQVGFIWNSINANLGIQSEEEISGRYIAYLDVDRTFNTYGIRVAMDYTAFARRDLSATPYYLTGNEGMGKLKLIGDTYFDISWGNVTLSDKAADAVGFSEKLITYFVVRGNFGIAWEKGISAKRSITYGLGFDFFMNSLGFGFADDKVINDPATFGIFARVEMVL